MIKLNEIIGKKRIVKSEQELELQRKNDQYLVDRAKISLQIWSTRCITVCIIILSLGFIIIFGKYIWCLAIKSEVDITTQEILSNILDWTMKIVIGWLLKAHFEKK